MKTIIRIITVAIALGTLNLELETCFAQTIAGGVSHALVVCSDNTAMAWGYNSNGTLGDGTNTDSNVPVQVSSLTGVIAVAGGMIHSLALCNNNTVWAWGGNVSGQLGNGTNISSNVPVQVSSLTGIIAIAVGEERSLALKNDGTVWAWGNNSYGQLGNGTNTNSNVPVQVSGLTGITAIVAGYWHSLALKNDSTVWTWGQNTSGQLGNGSTTNSNVPVPVSSLTGITALAGGRRHSLALKNDSTVHVWGLNDNGQLGIGTTGGVGCTSSNPNCFKTTPVKVSSLTGITTIATGWRHSLAVKNDGTVRAWGLNSDGQLGNGTNTDSNVPVQVTGLCQMSNAVNEITEPLSILVYPNPSTGKIQVTGNQYLVTNMEIYNVLGKRIYRLPITDYRLPITFDLSSQPSGLYFLNIKTENKSLTQKIIINHN